MSTSLYVSLRSMTETQRARFSLEVQKRIKKEAADLKREQKKTAKAEKDLAAYLARQPAKRGVLQPFALNLLETRVRATESLIRKADRDAAVLAEGRSPARLAEYEPMTEEERGELVAKLALFRPALHDAMTARQRATAARRSLSSQ